MSQIKLTKVKLIKDGEKVEISYRESGDLQRTADDVYDNVPHPDLINAVQALKPHLAILCGQIKPSEANKADLDSFKVNGYHIGGKEEDEGIKIVGGMTGPYGYVPLNTPFLRLESQDSTYSLLADLKEKVAVIDSEAASFMNGEKLAQPSMFPEERDKVKKIVIAKPEGDEEKSPFTDGPKLEPTPPAKGRGRKVAQSAEVPSGDLDQPKSKRKK